MKKILFFILFTFFLISCSVDQDPDPELTYFTKLIEGKFSSKEQALDEQGYMNVCLVNSLIWTHRSDGYWLYHELCSEEDPKTIYNQRVIRVHRLDSSTIASTSYALSNRKKYRNGWKNIEIFNDLTPDSLNMREGCDLIYKKKTSTIYLGKTKTGTCLSSFRKDMSYTTSNVVVSRDKITSWDRGYDSIGRQVWGKIQGPYRYQRVQDKK